MPDRSQLWLASRSTFERGTQHCPFARWVENHAGPYGYGFARRAMSLPLVTGTYAHLPLTEILQWVIDARKQNNLQPTTVPDEVIRWAVELGVEKYDEVVAKRGILKLAELEPEAADEAIEQARRLRNLIQEQKFLIEGLVWAWCLVRLPQLLEEYLIVDQEQENEYVTECTCGIGAGIGNFEDHELKGCNGIGLMSRFDFLGQRRSDGKYGNFNFKTAGIANKGLNESWERKQQLMLEILGAEQRYGVEITHTWIETLIKGKRDREYENRGDSGAPKIQNTALCYAYYCPPMPPTTGSQWRPQYNYVTADGMKYTVSKKAGFMKVPLWSVNPEEAFEGKPPEMSVSEYWLKLLAVDYPTHLQKCYSLIGPLPRNDGQIAKALRSINAEENLWRDRLWRIYEFSVANNVGWGDDRYHEFVETVIPRSWHCDPFADHPCVNQPICHPVTDDWRTPVEAELFVYRTPHHVPEAEQMQARGLVPPEAALAQEEGEQEERDE